LALQPATQSVLDLYCGNGNFSFPLAQAYPQAKITGVELSKRNVELARREAARRGLTHLEFVTDDVGRFLATDPSVPRPLLVLADPPRTGLESSVISQLTQLKAEAFIYISCQPMTLARDLELLLRTGYEMVAIQGFDMFPQTAHVETVVTMRRSKS
jgi:tRNA/tmRNA/rRNA uracil-C5-methylase (TrmA/RlmC/RlmD family)